MKIFVRPIHGSIRYFLISRLPEVSFLFVCDVINSTLNLAGVYMTLVRHFGACVYKFVANSFLFSLWIQEITHTWLASHGVRIFLDHECGTLNELRLNYDHYSIRFWWDTKSVSKSYSRSEQDTSTDPAMTVRCHGPSEHGRSPWWHFFQGIIVTSCQLFFAWRIYQLRKNVLPALLVAIFATVGGGECITFMIDWGRNKRCG